MKLYSCALAAIQKLTHSLHYEKLQSIGYTRCYRLANAGRVKSVARGVCDRPRAAFTLALWLAYNARGLLAFGVTNKTK